MGFEISNDRNKRRDRQDVGNKCAEKSGSPPNLQHQRRRMSARPAQQLPCDDAGHPRRLQCANDNEQRQKKSQRPPINPFLDDRFRSFAR